MVFLDANENPFENGVNRYPDPQQRSLKAILAEQRSVETKHILLGNGSDEVLDLLFRAFCEPKIDNVITCPPTYGMYKVLSGLNHIENREVLLTDDFQLNTDQILSTVDAQTKLIFICSPNNPTGNSFSESSILRVLNNFNGLVVIDEAYIDFSSHGGWLSRLNEFPNLVISQTLSKAYGMAGIRLGICFASEGIISILNNIKPPYNVNDLTQNHAKKRVSNVIRIKSEVNEIIEQKGILLKVLMKIAFVRTIYPSDANFLLVKVDDADKRYDQLLKCGVVVRNRSRQPLCENTLRITIGTPEENIKLVEALKTIGK
jgi:histidinol-phosphate aminotransferase